MKELSLSLIIIFIAITVIPFLSKRVHFSAIALEIIFGILIGKSFFDIVPTNSIIEFFSSFGLIYLMFLAGLETNFTEVRKYFSETLIIVLFSILVPFSSGYLLADYVKMPPLLFGTILSTTSIGLILPLTKEIQGRQKLKQILFGSVALVDIISMFLLAFSLAYIQDSLGLYFFYSLTVILILFMIPWIIKRLNIYGK